ncbi:hypothetical protein NSK_002370 [Nannochloropsis salina CCMP1776]|uniref:STI1 domain-containing protein n=1 Tax=Nannochloropsis salina CCMP1776 TaxID=1027361 RepID=A0A4D9D3P6_9STRA|nr:hypothetical protein NSK_002370 [Nannochloropsis salina CCMP1776]|eukprot:TFJ86162.1 hypothetical protein NSK_002370 [Nannochloropsis salina CCMP1776]
MSRPASFLRPVALLLGVLVLFLVSSSADALFSKLAKKKKQQEQQHEEKVFTGTESANMGLEAFQDLFANPSGMQELMNMQKDPEIMREVETLLEDPEFQAYMAEYMNSDAVKESLKMAEKLANDPKALEAFQSKMLAAMQGNAEDGTESARTGLETLAASVQDPSGLMQAMDMLKDPAVVKEVESLMADPDFQREMKKMAESPMFAEAMQQAQALTEELQKDPAKLEAFMKDLESEMAKMGGAAGLPMGKAGAGRGRVEL